MTNLPTAKPLTPGLDPIQAKANSIKALLEKSKNEIAAALPKHLTPERMVRIAMTEFRKNPKLLQCNQASLLGAVIQASQLGLEPGHALGQCYLIPFKQEVQFIIGYRGMIELANRANVDVIARAVYSDDVFDFEFGLNEKLHHKPALKPSAEGKLTHVYAILTLPSGRKKFDVMTVEEVEVIRKRAPAGSKEDSPWTTDYDAMAKKTVIRRLFKYTPCSIEIQRAVGLDEQAEAGLSQNNGAIIETTGRQVGKGAEIAAKVAGQQEPEVDEMPPLPTEQAQEPSFESFQGGPGGEVK